MTPTRTIPAGRSIKTRVTVLVTGISLALLGLVTAIQGSLLATQLQEVLGAQQLSLTERLAADLDERIRSAHDALIAESRVIPAARAGDGDVLDHRLRIDAEQFTPVGPGLLPLAGLTPVAGTPFDFTAPRAIGDQAHAQVVQVLRAAAARQQGQHGDGSQPGRPRQQPAPLKHRAQQGADDADDEDEHRKESDWRGQDDKVDQERDHAARQYPLEQFGIGDWIVGVWLQF